MYMKDIISLFTFSVKILNLNRPDKSVAKRTSVVSEHSIKCLRFKKFDTMSSEFCEEHKNCLLYPHFAKVTHKYNYICYQ